MLTWVPKVLKRVTFMRKANAVWGCYENRGVPDPCRAVIMNSATANHEDMEMLVLCCQGFSFYKNS